MIEFYLGDLYKENVYELFRLIFYIDDDFFYGIDSVLMVLSKGGFDYKSLRTMGIMSKEKYLKPLQEIQKKMYSKTDSGTPGSVEVDVE